MVDCVIGGSPCQDLSLAGKRAGLAGARSGLYIEQIRIIKEMRQQDVLRGRTDVDVRPRYMVWENVPGAFSTNKGQDFAAVLEEAIRVAEPQAPNVDVPEKGWPTSGCFYDEMGKWSVAWRVLDAQFWGTSDKPLPQRRRRIALVADFGGLSAPEILFVRESVSGDIEPGKPKGKEAAGDAGNSAGGAVPCTLKIRGGCAGGGKGALVQEDKSATLSTLQDQTLFQPIIAVDQGGGKSGAHSYEGVSPTLTCTHGGEPAVVYGIGSYHSNAWKSDNPNSGVYVADSAKTLDSLNCGYPGCNQGGMAVVQPILDDQGGKQISVRYDGKCPTLRAETHGNLPCVMEATGYEMQAFGKYKDSGCANSLKARDYKDATCLVVAGVDCRNATEYPDMIGSIQSNMAHSLNGNGVVRVQYPQEIHDFVAENNSDAPHQQDMLQTADGIARTIAPGTHAAGSHLTKTIIRIGNRYTVRRLTPLECERLQGFPDGWTDIGEWVDSNGKRHKEADSPRYKALGNSIALPPWKWVLKRLCACYERDATMASLFDGIGGFPLIWEQLNGKGSCLWASEIEEFPMAVTKVRFGE